MAVIKTAAAVVAGFVVGAVIGLAWGKTTKKTAVESVKTSIDGGVITVSVDTVKAAKDGFSGVANSDTWAEIKKDMGW